MDKAEEQTKDKKDYSRDYEQKFKRCSPRYTAAEYMALKEKAESCNNTPTEFVKNISLNYKKKLNSPSKLTLEMKTQVRKLGVNNNQIAKQIHLFQYESDFEQLKKTIINTNEVLNKMLEKL